MQGTFAGHPGEGGDSGLQGRLGLFDILLGYGRAHLAHHVLDSGFAALVAQPPFLVLSGPFQGGNMSGQGNPPILVTFKFR